MSIEYELDPLTGERTGRWRRNQYYAVRDENGDWAKLPPSKLKKCEWREKR